MTKMNMNNIIFKKGDTKISIAQHLHEGKIFEQSILILDGKLADQNIITKENNKEFFFQDFDSFVDILNKISKDLDS